MSWLNFFVNQTDTGFDLEWQIKIFLKHKERISQTLADHKSCKRLREIWFKNVLLSKSERESDFDIFGCMSKCKTIGLHISLVCLICNISLIREIRRLVAVSMISIHCSPRRTCPGAVKGLDISAIKQVYLQATAWPPHWCLISSSTCMASYSDLTSIPVRDEATDGTLTQQSNENTAAHRPEKNPWHIQRLSCIHTECDSHQLSFPVWRILCSLPYQRSVHKLAAAAAYGMSYQLMILAL